MMDPSSLRDLLISWADLNSGSSNLDGLALLRLRLAETFGAIPGTTLEHVPLSGTAACVLRVRQRPAAPLQVLLSGHYDTVYEATHPFQRCEQIDANTLRGPGVVDMKGGLVVMHAALQEFERSPRAAHLGWEVLLTPDEETGSVATRPLLEASAPRFALGLVFEPARDNGDMVLSRKGTGIFTATCHGRAAHAGRSIDGRNAIVALAEFILAANRIPELLADVLVNVGAVRGGGAVNIVPDLAAADLNIRIARSDDAPRVVAQLRAAADRINQREGLRLELTGQFNRLPLEATPATEALFAAWQRCARELGASAVGWTHVAGGSDANLLGAAGLPCLDGLGPIGGGMHSSSEFVRISSLAEKARIAAHFLGQLATGEIAPPARSLPPK